MENEEKEFNPISNRVVNLAGATATVSIIVLILYALKVIPSNVSLSIAFFVSLPLVYSFIFGIILNKPNFSSVFRHYSFIGYLIIALVLYMIVLRPSSIVEGTRYFVHFILGLVLAIIGYSTYAMSYRLFLKKIKKYRWLASLSFGISFLITLTIAFILNHFNIFDLI